MPCSAAAPDTPARYTASLLARLAMIVAGPLLLLGGLELIGWLWETDQAQGVYAWEMVASRRISLTAHRAPDGRPGAGYTLMTPGRHYVWGGIAVDVNSRGLRGPEYAQPKPPGVFRILNMGDSVAMGWAVRMEDSYGQQLERLLNRAATPQRFEVINAGVPGWNLENALAYMTSEGLRLQPDLILLEVTVTNDILGSNALDQNALPVIEWLRAHTYAYPFLAVQFRTLAARIQGRSRIDVLDPPSEAAAYFPLSPSDPKYDSLWATVRQAALAAESAHSQFALVIFPTSFQAADLHPDLPQQAFTRRARAAGIPFVDLLPVYRAACQASGPDGCSGGTYTVFADVWMHPNVEGCRLAAAAIRDRLFAPPSDNAR